MVNGSKLKQKLAIGAIIAGLGFGIGANKDEIKETITGEKIINANYSVNTIKLSNLEEYLKSTHFYDNSGEFKLNIKEDFDYIFANKYRTNLNQSELLKFKQSLKRIYVESEKIKYKYLYFIRNQNTTEIKKEDYVNKLNLYKNSYSVKLVDYLNEVSKMVALSNLPIDFEMTNPEKYITKI